MARDNTQVIFSHRPTKDIVPGKTFTQKTSPAPTESDLQDGQLLVEVLYISLDPAMRGWMMPSRSYVTPLEEGELMRGGAIARVLASKADNAKTGDYVYAGTGWQEYAIVPANQYRVLQVPQGARLTDSLGVLGMTGLTAYFGLEKIGKIQKGDTVVVSGAAGATGSIVGQIAKLQGAGKVIGLAGSADKCKWLTEELGFDVALNYKDADFAKRFKEETPNFINVYWDNVGGEILDLALTQAAQNSRFVMCGSISQYNKGGDRHGIQNLFVVTTMRVRMEGFIVMDFMKEWGTGLQALGKWLGEGKLKREETIVKGGLAKSEEAFQQLFSGQNTGKMILELKNPDEHKL